MPLPPNFFLLILMIWNLCHLNLVMISSLLLKCQGHPTKWYFGKTHFIAFPSICNQRSLANSSPVTLSNPYFNWILHFSSKYLAIFGVVGVCFNPIKGLVLLKTARNFKDTDTFETYSIDVEKKRNQILWYIYKIKAKCTFYQPIFFDQNQVDQDHLHEKSDLSKNWLQHAYTWQFMEISNGEIFLRNDNEHL